MKSILTFCLVTISLLFSCRLEERKRAKRDEPNDTTITASAGTQKVELPAPYATKPKIKISEVIGWENNSTPEAPPGFTVTKYASGLNNPRWMYMLPNGDILVAEAKVESKGVDKVIQAVAGLPKSHSDAPNVNRITLFRDTNGDGLPDKQSTFLQNLNLPFGMLLIGENFYVANTDAIYRYEYHTGDTVINPGGEKVATLPGEGQHWTRNIIASKDGSKIYVAVGSSSNIAENGFDKEVNRANILVMNTDGSEMRVFASGLRNPVGMALSPDGRLFTTVNERDDLGDDLVPDFLTSVKDGGFYGWPYSYFGDNKDPRIKEEEQQPNLVKKAIIPDLALGSHTASLGLCFYTSEKFPAKYRNGAFIGQHGSWNRSILVGYKVVYIPFVNGKPQPPEDFLTGFIKNEPEGKVYGRPVGVLVDKKGALLVTDDASNTIWRVSYGK